MTPEGWQRIRPILESALELDSAHRPAFLKQVCTDPSLRQEIESLIAAHEQAGTHALNYPAVPAFLNEEETHFRLLPGKRVGPYEILEEVAQGGMGAVYRAVRADGQYQQQVAVKIVRSELGAESAAARFRNERQILASLDHPNIAKILDGGTTSDGLLYFVMEFINGLAITNYCDQHKASIDERLKIFRTVCASVHYAHQHLVIHRDIKPGNILVTSEGVPKLLDFGIAKILDPSLLAETAAVTMAGLWVMTPEYASPEQVRGQAITTATDVYSLGLVLYELLTGHRAYRFSSHLPHEIARAVLEADPEKPSTAIHRQDEITEQDKEKAPRTPELISGLRGDSLERLHQRISGDLDNIVLKAIRKEPHERYGSAEQLSEDIRRHLEHLPVLARKSTVAYRCRKYVLRHKIGVAAAALVFLSLLTGIDLTLREARIAHANELRAERRFNDVRKLSNSLIFEIHDGIRYLPGSTPVRELLVTRALQYFDSLSQEASGDSSLQRELASAYERVGDLQWSTDFASQGDVSGALHSHHKALAIREALAAAHPKDVTLQLELTDGYLRLADTMESMGDFPGALGLLRKIPPVVENAASQTTDAKVRDRQGGSYYYLGRMLSEMGQPVASLESYQKAVAIHRSTMTADARQALLLKTHLAGDYAGIAEQMMSTNQLDGAIKMQGQAVQILEELSGANPNSSPLSHFLGNCYDLMGTIWEKQGSPSKAVEYHRRANIAFSRLMASDPQNDLARKNFAFTDESLGESLIATGNVTEGLRRIREGLAIFEAMTEKGQKDRYVSSGLAESYFALGMAYSSLAMRARGPQKKSNWYEAKSWYRKSSDIFAQKHAQGSLDSNERHTEERAIRGIAECDAAIAKRSSTNR
jgi:serine/threonine protein kinase